MSDEMRELAQLIGGSPPQGLLAPVSTVQGQIISFDPATGDNTVFAMGATLTNLPMARTGAEVKYQAGDVVMLQRMANTYVIAYAIATPGSGTFGANSADSVASGGFASGMAVPTGGPYLARTSVNVPPWANKAAIMGWATACVHSGIDQDVQIGVDMNGQPLDSVTFFGANGHTCSGMVGGALTYQLQGETKLEFEGWLGVSTAIVASPANFIVVNCGVTFYRTTD